MDDLSPTTDLRSQAEAPAEPVQAAGRWAGRRLADAINEVFQLALTRGDLRTAAELRHENRHADPLIELARRDLQSKIARRRG